MKNYNSNIAGITFGVYTTMVFLIYFVVTIASGKPFNDIIPFIPTLQDSGIFNFLGSILIAATWGYFLGFSFFVTYNFYDKRFRKN